MKNFVYRDENNFNVIGVSVNDTPSEIAKIIPRGKKFYFFTSSNDITNIINNDEYAGVGVLKIVT